MLLAVAEAVGEISWVAVTVIISGAGTAALGILRWRDKDIKAISKDLEAKFNLQFQERFLEQDKRIKVLENKVAHLENGSIIATMKAVEIKATSLEERTRCLAQEIIDSLQMAPIPVVHLAASAQTATV